MTSLRSLRRSLRKILQLAARLTLQSAPKKLIGILESIAPHLLGYEGSVQLGSEALGIGENALAIKLYRHALQLRPDEILLRQQLGVTEFLTRNYSEAEGIFCIY
jgi:hypothetical protein